MVVKSRRQYWQDKWGTIDFIPVVRQRNVLYYTFCNGIAIGLFWGFSYFLPEKVRLAVKVNELAAICYWHISRYYWPGPVEWLLSILSFIISCHNHCHRPTEPNGKPPTMKMEKWKPSPIECEKPIPNNVKPEPIIVKNPVSQNDDDALFQKNLKFAEKFLNNPAITLNKGVRISCHFLLLSKNCLGSWDFFYFSWCINVSCVIGYRVD